MGADAPAARQLRRFLLLSGVLFIAKPEHLLCAVRIFPDPFTIVAPEDQMRPGPLLRAQVCLHGIRKLRAVIEGDDKTLSIWSYDTLRTHNNWASVRSPDRLPSQLPHRNEVRTLCSAETERDSWPSRLRSWLLLPLPLPTGTP